MLELISTTGDSDVMCVGSVCWLLVCYRKEIHIDIHFLRVTLFKLYLHVLENCK